MPILFFKRLLKRQPILRKNKIKLRKKGTEAVDTPKEAYGESAIKPVTICKWVKRFQEERERAKDEARKSPPRAPIAEQRSAIALGSARSILKNYSEM